MSFTPLFAIDVIGASTTGTKHVLHIAQSVNQLRFTVVGPTGKRHATVVCEDVDSTITHIVDFLTKGYTT